MAIRLHTLASMAWLIMTVSMVMATPCRAQGADFGAKAKSIGADPNLNSQDGLQSATPTDQVNELDTDDAPPPASGISTNDSPAGNDAALFDVNSSSGGANAALDAAPKDMGKGKEKPPPTELPAAANAGAAPAIAPPTNAAATPAGNADADALVKQMNNGSPPANATGKPAPTNATAPSAPAPNALAPAVPQPEVPPPILAPPLPPPNDFAGAPPVPGTRRIMAEGEAPEDYKVEPGDTLFDICGQLLDEPGYWPKLWALNPEIKNPHFIFPNMHLRFYPGDDDSPPYLQVVAEDDVIPIDKADLDEQLLVAEKVIFPAAAPVGEKSIVDVVDGQAVEPLNDNILTSGRVYHGGEISMHVPGFIYSQAKEPLGYVIGGREGESSLSLKGKALIEGISGITVGSRYTVLRPGKSVDSPYSGDRIGTYYQFVAHISILRGLGEDVFVGVVEDSLLGVQPGDIIVSYVSTLRHVPITENAPAPAPRNITVIGFEFPDQETGGTGHFVFLDKGNGDGLAPGNYVPIFQTPGYLSSAFGVTDLPIDYEKVGVARIIDVTDASACGYIVRSSQEIRVGDRGKKG